MAKPKQYRVVDKTGVVGFNGVIHASGDVISENEVPRANLNAWLRFGQVTEVSSDTEQGAGSEEPKKGKGK